MNKKNIIYEIGYLLFSVVIIILAFFPLNIYITIADEYEIKKGMKDNVLTIILFANIILSIVLLVLNIIEFSMKKSIKTIYKSMGILMIVFSYILTIITTLDYTKRTSNYRLQTDLYTETNNSILNSTITLNELEELKNENKSAIIYFERADCSECIAITPDLLEYLDNFGVKYYLYNTLDDRDNNHEKLTEILSLYTIESVPTLVELNKGKIENVYEQEDLSLLLYPED